MLQKEDIRLSLTYLVRIKYKDPEAVVYKNMKASEYSKFLHSYPDQARLKGLQIDTIKVKKQFEEVFS